ncbi:hypothetical protein P691DRAFT_785564 [Macrolepiota fuliginosa MF-IS2]|uniref:Uncharacterized protein n=1 Tax=Macrolepiota fuliginosa MF-IS2 TaxID=1400762 RepID=A0A9P5X6W4_9AGAR|nr:hypothetical protein P691DRAFT_785564 [Macrolepiota fuliginosa MF-IS2]
MGVLNGDQLPVDTEDQGIILGEGIIQGVKRLPNERYILSSRKAPTANIDNWLFARLEEQGKRTEWMITLVSGDSGHYHLYGVILVQVQLKFIMKAENPLCIRSGVAPSARCEALDTWVNGVGPMINTLWVNCRLGTDWTYKGLAFYSPRLSTLFV